ncbi:MAG TPA: hypothetical protein ENK39_06240 [Epsilonproteobacteria bacterium]|nr:hypothetical protein [Campylobacterota bacterium]
MNNEQKKIMILWLKRALGFTAISLWLTIIYTISQSSAPFREQAPYCMISTMMIFAVLSMVFKGLEYWEKKA